MSVEFSQEWLVDSLLVTTLLMGVILCLRRPVAKLFGPGVAYALWLIPAARLLMPSLEGNRPRCSKMARPSATLSATLSFPEYLLKLQPR